MKQILVGLITGIMLISASCNVINKKEESDQITAMDHKVMSVLWYQRSPEVKALYIQGFNIAKQSLVRHLPEYDKDVKKAVVVDIDETMLNNSPYEASEVFKGKGYAPDTWKEWTDLMKAKALPGAVEFSKFAKEHGVEVFYISNRKVNETETTLKNLQSEGFEFADEAHIILRDSVSSKKARRAIVSENYAIVLLIGDNLNDFSEVFEDRSDDFGKNIVEMYKDSFGDRFIMMPNPMYGEWEKSAYGDTYKISNEEKYKKRKEHLMPIK